MELAAPVPSERLLQRKMSRRLDQLSRHVGVEHLRGHQRLDHEDGLVDVADVLRRLRQLEDHVVVERGDVPGWEVWE